jgi:hypothetical protein
MREQHTQDSNLQHNHAHKSRLELETQHTESVTQIELKSLTQRIKCVESESRSLRMSLESLVYGSMCLGVPFIAPRQLGAVGDQFGRPSLTSVEWCTGQCGAPPDSHCHVRCTISFQIGRNRLLLLGAGWRTGHCPVHTGQSGATSRPLERATCRALIARTTVGAGAVGSSDSPVHHWTVRWILATSPFSFLESDEFVADDSPDSLVHHWTVRWIIAAQLRRFPRAASSSSTSQGHRTLSSANSAEKRRNELEKSWLCTANFSSAWHTGHCPVHHRTVQCARPSWSWLYTPNSFPIRFFSSQHCF